MDTYDVPKGHYYVVIDAAGSFVSSHTSIWPAKRAVQLNPTYEIRVKEDGVWRPGTWF